MNDLTLATLLTILKKSVWYIVTAMVVFAIIAYAFCAFIATPTYQAKVSFIGGNGGIGVEVEDSDKILNSDVTASMALINTYVGVLETRGVYEKVAKDVGLGYTAAQLKSMTSISSRDETSLFIDVKVTTENPKHSVKIANSFLENGAEYIVDVMPNAFISGVEKSREAKKNYPNTLTTVVLASVFGFVLVFGIAIIFNIMDKTVKGEENFTSVYDIPVLGTIPNFRVAARGEKK